MKMLKSMCLAVALGLLLTPALAQRGRGRDSDPPVRQAPPPQRNDPPPQRNDPPVRVDPPVRQTPPPQRNDPPVRVDPPVRQTPPPQRNDPPVRVDPPVRQTPPPQRNDPPVRVDPPVRQTPPPQRNDPPQRNNPPIRDNDRDRSDPPVRQGPPVRGNDNYGGTNNGGDHRPPTRRFPNTTSQLGGTTGPIRIDSQSNPSLFRRKTDARSGTASYGSNNNVLSRHRTDSPIQITRVSGNTIITLRDKVRRKEDVRLNIGGVRINYYHYDRNWCDDYFYYPYYYSNPYGYQCVISPWYYYPCLPPYLAYNRCVFLNFGPWNSNWHGTSYTWNRPNYYNNYNNDGYRDYRRGTFTDLDYAIDDIVNSFERQDRRAIGRLMPEQGNVAIYVDGNYSYSLNSDDFYDMFTDAVENTRTTRYDILSVQVNGNRARVNARHEYEDPWGRAVSVYHYYELQEDRHNMVITRFGVNNDGR